jgi:hypothetical protein
VLEEFVRDTQIAEVPDADGNDTEGWNNTSGPHVLGVFADSSPGEAIEQAAVVCHLSSVMLGAYELSGEGNLLGIE